MVLSCLIQTFPNQLEFKDLVQLTHQHDPEMDFFENMKHIQVKDNSAFPCLQNKHFKQFI
jgi:hypothetical protein